MFIRDIVRIYDECLEYDSAILNDNFLGITEDSRDVKLGYIFVAHIGYKVDATEFIEEAFNKGAKFVICDLKAKLNPNIDTKKIIKAHDTRKIFALINFYLNRNYIPKHLLTVTGTNGKTSTVSMVSQILDNLNKKNTTIGTLGVFVDNKFISESLTMPSSQDMVKYFKLAKEANCDYIISESSSQGIDQKRHYGLRFQVKAFTNVTQEHLDYHGDMENYYQVKKQLFDYNLDSSFVINIDDYYGDRLYHNFINKHIKIITYGKSENADLVLIKTESCFNSQKITFSYLGKQYTFTLNLIGEFQAYNLLCAIGMLLCIGINFNDICLVIEKIKKVKGRMNKITNNHNLNIFIDYSHTPHSMEIVLTQLKEISNNKIKIVFGCGGSRDKTKRAVMGKIAAQFADEVYITDDNPRLEDAANIRNEIEAGFHQANSKAIFYNIAGRDNAIKKAVLGLKPKEILVITGKGPEAYQIIGDQKYYFSDLDEVLKALELYGKNNPTI